MEDEVRQGTEDSTTQSEEIATEPESGETSTEVQETEGQPTSEESSSGPTLEQLQQLEESVRYHQSEKDKLASELKRLDDYGGIDNILTWASYLENEPDFAQWVQTRQQQQVLGTNMSDMDEDTQKAIEIVNKIADAKTQQAKQELYDQHIKPMVEAEQMKNLESNMTSLRDKYGDMFDTYRGKMAEMVQERPYFPENPSISELEDLMWSAIRESGDFDKVAADIYKKKVETAKAKDTGKSTTKSGTSSKQASTMWEAYQQAKEQH